jgi:aerobic-type carbon monoxide dehydrogenase small subunit (CoxS/CutS family)
MKNALAGMVVLLSISELQSSFSTFTQPNIRLSTELIHYKMATISFTLNGQKQTVDVDPGTSLLWVLREHLGLTGTKYSCGVSTCGACTVHLDGEAVTSCSSPVSMAEGRTVTTIEGLSKDNSHPLQKAWNEERVSQCGYCQSGQIMQAAALLARNPKPDRTEIIKSMSDVLCRCGTYLRIIKAIEKASKAK